MLKGKDINVMLDGVTIANGRECGLEVVCEVAEVSSPESPQWREFVPMRIAWQVSCQRLLVARSMIEAQALVGQTINLKFYSEGEMLIGTAIVAEANVTGTVGKLAVGGYKFQGTGPLTNEEGYVYLKTSDGEFFTVRK